MYIKIEVVIGRERYSKGVSKQIEMFIPDASVGSIKQHIPPMIEQVFEQSLVEYEAYWAEEVEEK